MALPRIEAESQDREPRGVRLLDPHTINQIAAGEVVERPASAVKELVENALDAGATRIEVELEGAGRRTIRVVDDGRGMDAHDADAALLRHATSKIRSSSDLTRVDSMGFRGEALPSIASVSRLRVSTATEDGVRTVLRVDGGERLPDSTEPGPRGTEVTVEDLFHNVPARLKFLKTDPTETAACVEAVSRAALARPDVAFLVRVEGREALRTSGSGELATSVAEAWGREAARAMLAVDRWDGSIRVRGLVSPPHFTRPNRSQQWFFVNGRAVKDRTLGAALDQAFRSITPERRFPLAVLWIELDPAHVDVNVSPTKSEVRFRRSGEAFDAVRRAVREALLAGGMVPSAEGVAAANQALRSARGEPQPASFGTAFGPLVGGGLGVMGQPAPVEPIQPGPQPELAEEVDAPASADIHQLLDGLKILSQMDCTFILAENRTSMLVIDQHVAHERILYEWLRDTRGAGEVERQALLTPETLELDRRTAELLSERLDELRELGFDLEPFGGSSFLVRSVPAIVRSRRPMEMLRDLAHELADAMGRGTATPARDELLILCSCKMAIKAGDPLGVPEMQRLVEDLARTENPYLCPHGRPITITWPKSDLRRRFKR